jgi:2-polyprenyl-3-methyl-5-hydroxy-6-metoxy-1,4-benzoquinol methylase
MNHPFLENSLLCIVCKQKILVYVEGDNCLTCSSCKTTFRIVEKIPIFLTSVIEKGKNSEFHQKLNTDFNYIDHYQKDADEFDYFQQRSGSTEHQERRIRQFISDQVPENTKSILDVGSGSAWVAKEFCKRSIVCSVDVSLKNTMEALKKYPSENHVAIVADAFNLPFNNQTFDCIIASEIIEHVYNPALFVQQLMNLLKTGGILILTTPYNEKIAYSLCVHCNKPTPHNAHIHSFNEKKLAAFFSTKECKNVKFKVFNNKILIYMRTYILLRYFPFKLWKILDSIINMIFRVPANILVKCEKC